jgi:hypothetical protein
VARDSVSELCLRARIVDPMTLPLKWPRPSILSAFRRTCESPLPERPMHDEDLSAVVMAEDADIQASRRLITRRPSKNTRMP